MLTELPSCHTAVPTVLSHAFMPPPARCHLLLPSHPLPTTIPRLKAIPHPCHMASPHHRSAELLPCLSTDGLLFHAPRFSIFSKLQKYRDGGNGVLRPVIVQLGGSPVPGICSGLQVRGCSDFVVQTCSANLQAGAWGVHIPTAAAHSCRPALSYSLHRWL